MLLGHHGKKLCHRVMANSSQMRKGQTLSINKLLTIRSVVNSILLINTMNTAKRLYSDKTTLPSSSSK